MTAGSRRGYPSQSSLCIAMAPTLASGTKAACRAANVPALGSPSRPYTGPHLARTHNLVGARAAWLRSSTLMDRIPACLYGIAGTVEPISTSSGFTVNKARKCCTRHRSRVIVVLRQVLTSPPDPRPRPVRRDFHRAEESLPVFEAHCCEAW